MDDLKKQRRGIRSQATRLIKDTEPADDYEREIILTRLAEIRTDLKTVDREILTLTKEDDLEAEVDTIEEYQSKILRAIRRLERKHPELPRIDSPKQISSNTRLPKLELPTFEGESTKWPTFWQRYEANIHQREEITAIEKMSYLINLLKGEPARLIEGFSITAENYGRAIEILKQYYGNQQNNVESILKEIMSMKPLISPFSTRELNALVTDITIRLRQLKNVGIDTTQNYHLLNITIKKLIPHEILITYEREKREEDDNPDQLMKFLEKEIICRRNVEDNTPLNPKATIFQPRNAPPAQRRLPFHPRAAVSPALPYPQRWRFSNHSQRMPSSTPPRWRPPNRSSQIVCYKCGLAGHIARECPSK